MDLTPCLYTLQNSIVYTNTLSNIVPYLNTLPSDLAEKPKVVENQSESSTEKPYASSANQSRVKNHSNTHESSPFGLKNLLDSGPHSVCYSLSSYIRSSTPLHLIDSISYFWLIHHPNKLSEGVKISPLPNNHPRGPWKKRSRKTLRVPKMKPIVPHLKFPLS